MSIEKKLLTDVLRAALLAACAGAAQATTVGISFDSAPAVDGSGLTTPITGATVYNFDSGMPAGYAGGGGIVVGSSGTFAAPADDPTHYLSVALNVPNGVEIAHFGQAYNYFGLYWGSIDGYNSLSFLSNNSVVATFTGADVIAAGAQFGDRFGAGANRYVNFLFSDGSFDSVQLTSTNYAFESDNHAVANVAAVPEPGTLGLMSLGLVAAALARRRAV
jgi:hypothetical protein